MLRTHNRIKIIEIKNTIAIVTAEIYIKFMLLSSL